MCRLTPQPIRLSAPADIAKTDIAKTDIAKASWRLECDSLWMTFRLQRLSLGDEMSDSTGTSQTLERS